MRPHTFLIFSFFFMSTVIFFTEMAMAQNKTNTVPVNVGVVLNMDTEGKMEMSCIKMALSDFYGSHGYYNTRLLLNTRDSKNDTVAAAAAALDLIKNVEVEAIIGPPSSMQANFLIDLGDKAQVPIISFSATSPSLSSLGSPYFIRATLNDCSQVQPLTSLIKNFGWREVVVIYVDDQFGRGIIPFLTDALQGIATRVTNRSLIAASATDDQIVAELQKLKAMHTRVFIVHMLPSLGTRIFDKAKEIGMMSDGYAWIITDALASELAGMDLDAMEGVIGVKPQVPRTKELESFKIRWKKEFEIENPGLIRGELSVFGLWAYDAATALAIAVEKIGAKKFGYRNENNNTSRVVTDLENFGVSGGGPALLQALHNTKFRGLSGNFRIVGGQLLSSDYQIVNIVNGGPRGIGFWTPEHGIVRDLNFPDTNNSSANLGSIIWPGDTVSPPKGWVMDVNGKKLKVGVPVKDGFSEFIKVTRNSSGNGWWVEGYCIAVFEAVIRALPYPVPYEYIPYGNADGKSNGTYDDLVNQVNLGNFDVAVGDITIRSNRSSYVDFTLPYTESGVTMITLNKDNKSKSPWLFFKPLTWDLWVTSFCSFVFIGFVIWALEHRINDDFRGPVLHQVGTMFYFSFATMVFAQRERVMSNLGRFVAIIWFFVVFILTQSYTASLTSMLTVQQLQPAVTNVNELIKNREFVGYQNNSFVHDLLLKMNFHESQLRAYGSAEVLNELLSKGSGNGGIAAAFDEIPYLKVFLSQYCSNYTIVEPTYKSDGFGIAFPIGSPLVHDVSRAVLTVTEGNEMTRIESAWLRNQTRCVNSTASSSSNSLGIASFWGLFLIALIAAAVALIIFSTAFIRENLPATPRFETSIWQKLEMLRRRFDQKDLSSHTCRKGDRISFQNLERVEVMEPSPCPDCPSNPSSFALNTSPMTNGPPTPSSTSNRTEGNIYFAGENGGHSPELAAHEIAPVVELVAINQESISDPH